MIKLTYFLLLPLSALLVGCGDKTDILKPEYRPLTEAVYASGTVQPANTYRLYARVQGVLLKQYVEVNDTVRPGQPLFLLDDGQARARSRQAGLLYDVARRSYGPGSTVVAQLQQEVATAQARMEKDSLNLARYRSLYAQSAVPRAQLDNAELAYTTSRNAWLGSRQRLTTQENAARAELQNAETQLQLSGLQQSDYLLSSEIMGMVYDILYEPGELVTQQKPLAILGDPGLLELQLNVDELDIHRVRIGQQVMVEIDTYPDSVFEARVHRIHPLLNDKDQTFRVDARFARPLPSRYAGLNAEANIVVSRKDKALAVPRGYLIGKDSLRIMKDGEPTNIRVRTGARNFEWVEILSGIDTETEIVKP